MSAQTADGAASLQPVVQADRVAANPDLAPLTRLSGQLPPWATVANQTAEAAVDLGSTIHVSVVLSRDPTAQAAFEQMLANQQNPVSPLYHHWVTPAQMGQLYGPTQNDLAAVRSWLTSQGLKIDSVAPSGMIVEASGTMAVVGNAFHTSFAYFKLAGKLRLSTLSEPSIPSALTPVIASISGLTETPLEPMSHAVSMKGVAPQYTISNGTAVYHFITPNDFATIYDVKSVYSSGNTGAMIGSKAQHIAIIGRSRVSATDISEYAADTDITNYTLNTIIPTTGVDPGAVCPIPTTTPPPTCATSGDQSEATLDVDRVIGTAPGAAVDLVVSASSTTYNGIYIAAAYNVNTLLDPIMNISFGACEAQAGSAGVDLWNTLFSTAAGEGISVFVSSDDSGASGCVEAFTPVPVMTTQVKSINYICSSGYATCVGGTEFNDTANPSTYWSTTNGAGNESALSYIPEGGWNEPSTTSTSGTTTTTTYAPASGGGGVSIYITKPSWQTGTGVPADGFRDVPDIAFSASGHDGYFACLAFAGGDCDNGYFEYFLGTSAAAPGMAGITALLNTKMGSAQGNVNSLLYGLAASHPAVFHDVTVASSGVTGCTTATPSMCNNSTPGPTTLTGGLAGYLVTAGYDQVTGLGSIDVANLLADATPAATLVSTSLTLTASANPISAGQSTTFTATLTPATSTPTPTGTVQFYSNGTAIGSAVTLSSDTATSASQTFATAGTFAITVIYSGDSTFAGSTSAALSLVVNASANPGSFTLAGNPTALTATPALNSGTTSTSTITATSVNGLTGTVALSCAVTPAATILPTCTMSPTSVTLTANGTITSTLSIVSTGDVGSCNTSEMRRPSWFGGPSGGVALASLLLLLLPGRRRKALRGAAIVCLLTAGLGALSGCGGSSRSACPQVVASGTTPGTYTVTVTGTSGTVTANTTVSITVN